MNSIFIIMIILMAISGAVVIYYLYTPQKNALIRALTTPAGTGLVGSVPIVPSSSERLLPSSSAFSPRKEISLEEKFFRAGILTDKQKRNFFWLRIAAPLVGLGIGSFLGSLVAFKFIVMGSIVGFFLGLQLPISYLDRAAIKRDDEIMRFLPLVIEQLVIGVSSSLEIGPCIQRVVSMADERDSHNVVTELLRHVHQLILTGSSLDEALLEIGNLSGHTELKHTFISLGQVSRHGGEITRQLQELADAVSTQRETRIEAKIKRLELEATGPVALVFISFMSVLLVGIGLQIMKALDA